MTKARRYAVVSIYLAALAFSVVAPRIAPSEISEAAAFVIYRLTIGVLLMALLIAPTASEFIAVRRARRAAGWK